jgi:hypothetical protein
MVQDFKMKVQVSRCANGPGAVIKKHAQGRQAVKNDDKPLRRRRKCEESGGSGEDKSYQEKTSHIKKCVADAVGN